MLKYTLLENELTDHPNDYFAIAHATESYNQAKFIKRLLGKGTLMTETDAVAALNAIENTILEIIEEGDTLNLPLLNTSFSIFGTFNGPLDTFDNSRHKININLLKGTVLRKAEKHIAIEKTRTNLIKPNILEVKDSLSGKTNMVLTPNGIVEIRGHLLKIAGDDPACGLWFISNHTEIKATIFSENKPSSLIAMIPPLERGSWQIKIVTQHSRTRILKKPKTFVYPVLFTVE